MYTSRRGIVLKRKPVEPLVLSDVPDNSLRFTPEGVERLGFDGYHPLAYYLRATPWQRVRAVSARLRVEAQELGPFARVWYGIEALRARE